MDGDTLANSDVFNIYDSVDSSLDEAAEPTGETIDDQVEPSNSTMMMLHCLFAMVFAAATLGLLNCLGFVVRSGVCCPPSSGYSRCEIWQDFRSVLSFVFGALLCCVLTGSDRNNNGQDSTGKVQLYSCLL
jgi:hypothetical protein